MPTNIAWAEETWNPITGCSKISEGCRYCYAERNAMRFHNSLPWTEPNVNANIKIWPDRLQIPYKWKDKRRIFAGSMTDLFHPHIHPDFLIDIFKVMRGCSQHDFLVLTKRIALAEQLAQHTPFPENMWIGTSVEDERAKPRIDVLRRIKGKIRFISFEPLIGDVGKLDLSGIQWVIVGGESGQQHRPMPHEWAWKIYRQAREQNVAFFFKQSSAVYPEVGTSLIDDDGKEHHIQEYPALAMQPESAEPPTTNNTQLSLF